MTDLAPLEAALAAATPLPWAVETLRERHSHVLALHCAYVRKMYIDMAPEGECGQAYTAFSDGLRSALAAAEHAEPEGWQLVPKEPTTAMVMAGWIDMEDVGPSDIYRAMLAAAPKATP